MTMKTKETYIIQIRRIDFDENWYDYSSAPNKEQAEREYTHWKETAMDSESFRLIIRYSMIVDVVIEE